MDAKHYSSLNSKGNTAMHTGFRFDRERIFIHCTLVIHLSTLLRSLCKDYWYWKSENVCVNLTLILAFREVQPKVISMWFPWKYGVHKNKYKTLISNTETFCYCIRPRK